MRTQVVVASTNDPYTLIRPDTGNSATLALKPNGNGIAIVVNDANQAQNFGNIISFVVNAELKATDTITMTIVMPNIVESYNLKKLFEYSNSPTTKPDWSLYYSNSSTDTPVDLSTLFSSAGSKQVIVDVGPDFTTYKYKGTIDSLKSANITQLHLSLILQPHTVKNIYQTKSSCNDKNIPMKVKYSITQEVA